MSNIWDITDIECLVAVVAGWLVFPPSQYWYFSIGFSVQCPPPCSLLCSPGAVLIIPGAVLLNPSAVEVFVTCCGSSSAELWKF